MQQLKHKQRWLYILCMFFTLLSLWVGVKIVLIFQIVLNISDFLQMHDGWRSSFLWVYSFPPVLSLFLVLVFPPSLPLPACDSQLIQTRQVAPSLSEWSLDSSPTGSFQPPALSERGALTLSRGTPSLPDWISREKQMPGLRHTTTARNGSKWGNVTAKSSLMFQKVSFSLLTVFFDPSPGWSGEDKTPHRHHHAGGQGLRGGAVCVRV